MSDFQSQISILTRSMLNLEKLWEFAGFDPNQEQKDAIRHVDGPLYLTAGPGSGKTRVLLWRTLNLIVFHGVQPEEIFLSTFTEKAAHQLKEGLQSLLGIVTNINGQPYDLAQMYIGTVHSLCQRILTDRRRFFIDRHRSQPPALLDELGQYFHLSKNRNWTGLLAQAGIDTTSGLGAANGLINAVFGDQSESKHVAVTNCISLFNRFSEECIDSQKALERLEQGDQQLLKYFQVHSLASEQVLMMLRLYSAYLASLNPLSGQAGGNPVQGKLTDFSLLQQEAYRVLENFAGSGNVFKHVIVDEYQDTNTIQERIFFKLANGTKNICVVGDDDQALYRFRGATVENFVEFPTRCKTYLGIEPKRIPLSVNYRSCQNIVSFYTTFIEQIGWSRQDGMPGQYRVADKNIQANEKDGLPSVVASTASEPEAACEEIASLVRQLIDDGKVENPNQIAFLFPSMKYRGEMVKAVERMKKALEEKDLKVYAPRAGRFLEVDEAYDVFGLFVQIFGKPKDIAAHGYDYGSFKDWLGQVSAQGEELVRQDPLLKQYVNDRKTELARITQDYQALMRTVERNRWRMDAPFDLGVMKRALYNTPGFSDQGKKLLSSAYLDRVVQDRARKHIPLTLAYVIKRITSLDWSVLDLFYRLCGFEHFKKMFDKAQREGDEGPVANLGLITQYLGRFIDEYISIITADLLTEGLFQQVFFFSYLFALYRLGETEYEDAEDPFPKGRIPFLTIHQAKGLEFPVVILGNPRKDDRGPSKVEVIVRPFLTRAPGEPLERMNEFDIMRMFYVALSRAQNLLVIAHYKGSGQHINTPFKNLLTDQFLRIPDLTINIVQSAKTRKNTLPKTYSFTTDFLAYRKCPRQYMIFQKYGFTPSRSETMFFGSLVHRTLEDLHHELIRRRNQS